MRGTLFLIFLVNLSIAQAQLMTDQAEQQGIVVSNTGISGSGVSAFDFNSDGWPDLSFAIYNSGIQRYINVQGNFEYYDNLIPNENVEPEMILYGDYDNDGDADLFVTTFQGSCYLFNNIDGQLVDVTVDSNIIQNPNAQSQGASWGDYDRDGFLDLYVCNFNTLESQANWLYHNNGDGTFTETAELLGVDNGFAPTFQSVFMDYNNDYWPDIYLINDRDDENVMYKNNGDGSFTDVSIEIGVNQVMDAMSGTVGDYDNDGDEDIFISNGVEGNVLLNNSGGIFSIVSEGTELVMNELCWGATWIDVKNNGTKDLYVCGVNGEPNLTNRFFRYNNGEFNESTLVFDSNQFHAYSTASADFNRDGDPDLAVHASSPYNSRLFMNTGTAQYSLQIQLEGTSSNRDAIGATLLSYTDGTPSYLYTKSGEGYLSQNSQYILSGMGSNQQADSVLVSWPSGFQEMYYNLESGQLHLLREGSTLEESIQYSELNFCEGDSIYLNASSSEPVLWSTGENSQGIWVNSSGIHSYVSQNEFNILTHSDTVTTMVSPIISSEVTGTSPTCFNSNNGSLNVTIDPNPNSFYWSNGADSLNQENLAAGTYILSMTNALGCLYTDSIVLQNPDPIAINVSTQNVLCYDQNNGSAEISAAGGTGELSIDLEDISLDSLEAGFYEFTVFDENNCFLDFSFSILSPDSLSIEPSIQNATSEELGQIQVNPSGGTPPYSYYWSNGASEENVSNLSEGTYYLTLVDDNSCTFFHELNIDLVLGMTELGFTLGHPFPNPASHQVSLSIPEVPALVELRSVNGSLVRSLQTVGDVLLSLEGVDSGCYFLTIAMPEQIASFKMFVR